MAYKRNASTIAECTNAGTQKVHAQALGYGVRLRGRKGPADPHGVQQLCAQDLDGLRLGGSVCGDKHPRGQQFESMPMTRKAEREVTVTNKEPASAR